MITPKLYGRLGNQLFQVLAAIGLALKNNVGYCIPRKTINPGLWTNYMIHFQGLKLCEVSGKCPKGQELYAWQNHEYQEIPLLNGGNMLIDGYFQSYEYFYDYIDEIRKILHIPEINHRSDTIGIHIRRGDYITLQDKHPLIPESYYINALKLIGSDYKKIEIFTDDLVTVQAEFTELMKLPYQIKVRTQYHAFDDFMD